MTEATIEHTGPREMTCPTCNARQVWSDQCRRCKTDLSLLQQIRQAAETEHRRCLRELSAGRPRQALRHAHRYASYVGHADASRLLGGCSLLCEDWFNSLRGISS
jgi:hypothetical protein